MPLFSQLLSFFQARTPKFECGSEVLILADSENASIAYIVEPHLSREGKDYCIINADKISPNSVDFVGCRILIIVRYVPKRWIKTLRDFRARGGLIVYFMDDDLLDEAAIHQLPEKYARKIRAGALQYRQIIGELCSELWVASPYLFDKYKKFGPRLIEPRLTEAVLFQKNLPTVCYHGTSSHREEISWLVPIIATTQKLGITRFEIFGDIEVSRQYRNIAGVAIIHPMTWPNYLAYTGAVQKDIALAPLLPGPFNAARGPTKFFDFVRMGAVGIYSDVEPYKGFIRDGIDGILLPNDPMLWIKTIQDLATDAGKRQKMKLQAHERALAMTRS